MTTSIPISPIDISMDEYASISTLDMTLLISCLSFWLIIYHHFVLSSTTGSPNNFDSPFISNLHSIPLCILALLSLQQIIPETVPLCWSTSFFVFDLLDAIVRREHMWLVHAVISLALNVLTGFSARHRALRSVSKGFFAEASTPFLNHWKKSKSYPSYLIFFLAFTLCRIVWVPYFIYGTYAIHLEGQIDYLIWPSILFYVLQLAWYGKMCAMAIWYKHPKEKEGVKEQ